MKIFENQLYKSNTLAHFQMRPCTKISKGVKEYSFNLGVTRINAIKLVTTGDSPGVDFITKSNTAYKLIYINADLLFNNFVDL